MKKLLITLSFIIAGSASYAQLNFDTFLEAGTDDANAYLQGYLEPAFVGFGYGLNSGWYNTGKPHKLLGFDITTGVSLAAVQDEGRYFTFNDSDFTRMSVSDGSGSAELPTIFGPNAAADDIPELTFWSDNAQTEETLRVTGLTGAGIEENEVYPFATAMVPAPYAQIGIGLIKNTEVKLRIVPEQNIEGNTINMFGLGVMHDIKQWIPGMKLLPFDLSGFFGFNKMTTTISIDEDLGQYSELNISGTTIQAIASKKLALLTVYGGLGYITTSTDFSMLGDYDVAGTILSDPVAFDYSSSGLRANVGARVKILVLTLHAEYAIQKYNTLTAGIGVSIR